MLTNEIEAAREKLYAQIDDSADRINLIVSFKLLSFAQKYRIIKYKEPFNISKFNCSKKSMEAAIDHIFGVLLVNCEFEDWKVTAHITVENYFFWNLVLNYEFHKDILKIMRELLPMQYTARVILYPSNMPKK